MSQNQRLKILLLCHHLTLQLKATRDQLLQARAQSNHSQAGAVDILSQSTRLPLSGPPHPSPGILAFRPLSLGGPQQLVHLPSLRLPVQKLGQATVKTRKTVLQLCTCLVCLAQSLLHLVKAGTVTCMPSRLPCRACHLRYREYQRRRWVALNSGSPCHYVLHSKPSRVSLNDPQNFLEKKNREHPGPLPLASSVVTGGHRRNA